MAKLYHQGAELEVYPRSTPIVWGSAGLGDLEHRKGESFVRRTRFRSLGHTSLGDALAKAEDDFQNVTNRAGGQVVSHQWGVYPVKNNNNRYFLGSQAKITQEHPNLLPEHHILVAEVELIRGTRKLSTKQRQAIRHACSTYVEEVPSGESYWSEALPLQFVTAEPSEPGQKWPIILVDIEPIMDIKTERP